MNALLAVRVLKARSPEQEKYLSDNRDRYIEQSRNTRNGVVAYLPARKPNTQTPPMGGKDEQP